MLKMPRKGIVNRSKRKVNDASNDPIKDVGRSSVLGTFTEQFRHSKQTCILESENE